MDIDVPISVAYNCYSDREAIPQWMPFISSVKVRSIRFFCFINFQAAFIVMRNFVIALLHFNIEFSQFWIIFGLGIHHI